MTSQIIAPPTVQPITLAEAKAHLRVSSTEEDDVISALIKAAVELLERETGIAMITQSWRLWLEKLPTSDIVCLPRHPVKRIIQITWYDEDGMPNILDGNAYFLNSITRPARLRFNRSVCPKGMCNGIEIDFEAGFGDVGSDTPDMLRRALLALVSHWFEFRGVYSADDQPVSVPDIYERLTRHYRQVRL